MPPLYPASFREPRLAAPATQRFSLNAKGKFKSSNTSPVVNGKILKDGQLQLKVKIKKTSLAGLLDANLPKPGRVTSVPVRLYVCGQVYAGDADAVYTAKLGVSGKLKTPKAPR